MEGAVGGGAEGKENGYQISSNWLIYMEMGNSPLACRQSQWSQMQVTHLAGDNLGRLGLIFPDSNRLPYALFGT